MKPLLTNKSGFTLLETMIAMAIMLIAFASILMVESSSINVADKAKQMNIVAMLAKRTMIKAEYDVEGKTFDEIKKEETGNFDEPYRDYKWKREVKEIKFPSLAAGGGKSGQSGDSNSGGNDQNNNASADMITKLITNFLSKSVRELTVTVTWPRANGEQSYSVSTYWVDLNHDFQLSE